MAADRLTEHDGNTYYLDEEGVRAANQWISFPNGPEEELCEESVTTVWYYFGPSGKAYTETKKTIDGSYYTFGQEEMDR